MIYAFKIVLIVLIIFMTGTVPHAVADNPAGALRESIDNLIKTYGAEYSDGAEFLKQLDTVEASGDKVALEKLRLEAMISNPLVSGSPILFVVRNQYKSDHHSTATIFQTNEINAEKFRGGSAIKLIDLATGQTTTLIESKTGVVRDPELSYDGKRVVFSMRKDGSDNYHIYEMNIDGSAVRQLTFVKGAADIDPEYLPDGGIAFSSTRDVKYCQCNRHIMANIFRMDGDGDNVIQIGGSGLFEGHSHVMPDGRILYDRWEYVDRQFGASFGLWTINPDGTNPALFYGNNAWVPGMIADARMIPGTHNFVATFGSCHDRPWGAIAIVDRTRGLDGAKPIIKIWPAYTRKWLENQHNAEWHTHGIDLFKRTNPKYEDPYPLNDKYFLCSRTLAGERMGLFLLDVFGNEILLHEEVKGCYDPMPLTSRKRPQIIPDRTDFTKKEGTFYVYDVYQGGAMENVPRGTIKYLRVVEAPYKRAWSLGSWNIDATQAPAMNWNLVNNKRILGDAPVETDGSAYFKVPANKFIYFMALDKNKMMVQSMRSGTIIQPGETSGCVGCHEYRQSSVPNHTRLAWIKPPAELQPWYGEPHKFNYLTDVQPVFDKNCISCHDYGRMAEKMLNLSGDLGLVFNTSYIELHRRSALRWYADKPDAAKLLVKAVHDGPPAVLPPYAWGSHRSKLVDVLRSNHNGVKLSEEEIARITTWIDLNTPYYGAYTTVYPDNLFGRSPLINAQLHELSNLTGLKFNKATEMKGSQINFTRPKLSPCLSVFKDKSSPEYLKALAIIKAGKEKLRQQPREDMLGSAAQPQSPADLSRHQRHLKQIKAESKSRQNN